MTDPLTSAALVYRRISHLPDMCKLDPVLGALLGLLPMQISQAGDIAALNGRAHRLVERRLGRQMPRAAPVDKGASVGAYRGSSAGAPSCTR